MTHLERLKSWRDQAKDKLKLLKPGTTYHEEVEGIVAMYQRAIDRMEVDKKKGREPGE